MEEPKEGPYGLSSPAATPAAALHHTLSYTPAANPRMERPCQIQEYPQKKHHSYVKARKQNKPIEIDGVRKCFSFDGKVETPSSVPSSQFPLRRLKRVVGACIKTFELSSKHCEFSVVAFLLSTNFPSMFLNAYHIAEVDK